MPAAIEGYHTNEMKISARMGILGGGVILLTAVSVYVASQLPAWAANGLLHPIRHRVHQPPPAHCEESVFTGAGVTLRGWNCRASGTPRGTVVYLHGVADNRTSGSAIAERYCGRGFEVVAYDSRGHGESGGDTCTYGYFEKKDLHRVLDTLEPHRIVLFGTSLGAAVALQEAAEDKRISAVIAVESFSDLRTVAVERAPFFLTRATIRKAFLLAEEWGRFRVDAVSPVAAAAHISVPVLLIHGALDRDTPVAHSQRILAALRGPKQLIVVPGAHHNESLQGDVWSEIDKWIDGAVRE
ncbi:MAG: alpha/beta fold hydrolase [Acidobacteriia bacterium]|nr:alpha/beta fold hydrolase [Terriglobia bacterium]